MTKFPTSATAVCTMMCPKRQAELDLDKILTVSRNRYGFLFYFYSKYLLYGHCHTGVTGIRFPVTLSDLCSVVLCCVCSFVSFFYFFISDVWLTFSSESISYSRTLFDLTCSIICYLFFSFFFDNI